MKFIFLYSGVEKIKRVKAKFRSLNPQFEYGNSNSDDCFLATTDTDTRSVVHEGSRVGLVQGYVRYPGSNSYNNVQSHHERLAMEMLDGRFPLDDDVASSFAAFALDYGNKKVSIANDSLGFYPIYHCIRDSELIISSHLLLISQIFDVEIDYTGVAQRLTGPEFCNFGGRTIIAGVSRLLPGEYISFDLAKNLEAAYKYDNSLYKGEFTMGLRDSAEKAWYTTRSESQRCFEYDGKVAIGLSGGMDSRLLLASVPEDKDIECYTYGKEEFYETAIARRCAHVTGAHFKSFPADKYLFPDRKDLMAHVYATEAVGINPWLSVLEGTQNRSERVPFALGDMCEAIAGRNIKTYSTREARIKGFLGWKKVRWTELTPALFQRWKKRNTELILGKVPETESFAFIADRAQILSETEADLENLYRRIGSHEIPYAELLDELFAWYVHSRIPMSKQLMVLSANFYPVSPTMSAQSLRLISAIHPSHRLNGTLMDQIFRVGDLQKYGRVPTAQIPFIGYNRNHRVKLLMWGLRSKADQIMIKAAEKRKTPSARNRLLNSANWAKIYSDADPKVIRSWFSPDFIGADRFIKVFIARACQKAHPLTNFDIVSAAALNIEIEFIKAGGKLHSDGY
ncbi:MAG: hypothetical protein WBD16_06290 [Pyrinomonadaceae bacterium]